MAKKGKLISMDKNSSNRRAQTKMNIAVSLLYQVAVAVVGLILPRFVLGYYGSEVNGMVQSISQFLSYTALLECGIGGMVAAMFYKPLAENDTEAVSDIFNNTKNFFKKISVIYAVFVGILAVLGGFIIKTSMDNLYVGFMVLILGVSNYFSYYFALPHRLLLRADQKLRIPQIFQTITVILNAIFTILLIMLGANIHTVKLVSAVVFLITPIGVRAYVKKHYSLSKKIFDSNRELPRKSDGIAHHLSFFIHNNTDIVILTLFRGVKEVSVYSVYNSVVVAVASLMTAVSSGIAATLGNIIALDENENLKKSFEIYNAVNITFASFFCVCFALLLVPFVTVYIGDISDVNYIRPAFAYLLIATEWVYFIRIPYTTAATSAGHYRQTKRGAIIEAVLNVTLSLILVNFMGLTGVIIGTFVAMVYRTWDMVLYLSKNIMNRSVVKFLTDISVNIIVCGTLILLMKYFMGVSTDNFGAFVIDAVIVAAVSFPVVVIVNVLINSELRKMIINKLKRREG